MAYNAGPAPTNPNDPLAQFRAQRSAQGLQTNATDADVLNSPAYKAYVSGQGGGGVAAAMTGASPDLSVSGGSVGVSAAPAADAGTDSGSAVSGGDKSAALSGFASAVMGASADVNGKDGVAMPTSGSTLNSRLGLRTAPILRGLREAGVSY